MSGRVPRGRRLRTIRDGRDGIWSTFLQQCYISLFRPRDVVLLLVGTGIGALLMIISSPNGDDVGLGCTMAAMTNIATHPQQSQQQQQQPQSSSIPSTIPHGFHPIFSYWGKFDFLTDPIPADRWYLKTSPQHNSNPIGGEWYGQHGQDVAIAKFFQFRSGGYFIDLAANDAVWASNTFGLEQNLNWKGICIEPNPQYWHRLSYRNCHVVGAIVGATANEAVQVNLGVDKLAGPYGGIVGAEFDNKQSKTNKQANSNNNNKNNNKNAETRYTVPLETILDMFQAPTTIEYLSLDVEGAESFIMKSFPFHKYTFLTLSIERPKEDLQQLLQQQGYQKVMDFKRGDTLWAHSSVYQQGTSHVVEQFPEEIQHHKITQSRAAFLAAVGEKGTSRTTISSSS